ncbi:MAG: glycosyltransferase family 9 protein [Candidatus Cloacimonetes bacterium]|nr:glycosyltransferase family 9 protein [Candidatus Cloacimonadota bacterium]
MMIHTDKIKKILIIQFKPFGDVLLNTGYLPSLHKKFPEAEICFLVASPFHKVLHNNPYLSKLIVFRNIKKKGLSYLLERIKLFIRLRSEKFDLVIDQMRGTGSAQIAFFTGARYRLGLADCKFSFLYNIKTYQHANTYSASMKFDLLKPLGITKPDNYSLYFHITNESHLYINKWIKDNGLVEDKIVCLSPGSPVPKKKWKAELYAELADIIIEKTNHKVALLWAPNEYQDVQSVKSFMKNDPIIAPPTDFNQAGAFLQRCIILICNDGGLNHLSAAVGTKSLAIFGNTNPNNWSPDFAGHSYVYNDSHDSTRDNSFGLSPKIVFEKFIVMTGV